MRFRCVHDSRMASALAAAELLAARALRRYERSVDLFLAPSEYVAQRMRESGLPSSRLRVMPNALDAEEPYAGGTDEDYIFAFGRLVRVKGFSAIVALAERMPDVRFVLAGDGPERGDLEGQATHLANLQLTGFKAGDELRSLIRNARAVIVPSEWPEPFGMVVLEAWREARPIIAAQSGALGELVLDGQDGITFAPGDLDAAEAATRRLVVDPAFASRLGSAGRRRLEHDFSISLHLDRLESTYRELVVG